MPELTIEKLHDLREQQKKKLSDTASIRILVGMGTCGIAAGAETTYTTFAQEIEKNGIINVEIKRTGCIGQCSTEPTVEVHVPGMPDIIYGNVDSVAAKTIVRKHLMEKTLVSGNIFNKPSPDIITESTM